MRVVVIGSFALTFLFSGCALFQSRVDDRTRVLRTVASDPVWDLDLYEIACPDPGDSVPDADVFRENGHYYSFSDRVRWSMIEYYLDSVRIATNSLTSWQHTNEWYRTVRPRISDSLYAKYPCAYRRFEGQLFMTGDTVWRWLGDQVTLETSDQTLTLAQVLKPEHWYLFIYDSEGPTHSIGRGHYAERRVSFYVDAKGQVLHWRNTRKWLKKMRIV